MNAGFRRLMGGAALVAAGLLAAAAAHAAEVDLVVNKSGPATANPGDSIAYQIVIQNNGPDAAHGATFTDYLPPGLVGVSATCTASSGGAACPASMAASSTQVSGAVPTLPSGGRVTLAIQAQITSAVSTTSLRNEVVVFPPQGVSETRPATNSSIVNTALNLSADLSVTKSQTPAALDPNNFYGPRVRYTVTFKNNGNIPVPDVVVRDVLEAQNYFAQSRPVGHFERISCTRSAGGACADDVFLPSGSLDYMATWEMVMVQGYVALMQPGEEITVVYDVWWDKGAECTGYDDPDPITNKASIGGSDFHYVDPDYSNNTASTEMTSPPVPKCVALYPEVTKTQPAASGSIFGNGGASYHFIVTYENVLADGADMSGYSIHDTVALAGYLAQEGGSYSFANLSCSVNDASLASCPSLPATGSGTISPSTNLPGPWSADTLFQGQVPTWKSGGKLTIEYDLTVKASQPACGLAAQGAFENQAGIGGLSVTRRALYPQAPIDPCPTFELEVKKEASASMLRPGVPVDFTLTYTNHGPSVASNVLLSDDLVLFPFLGGAHYELQPQGCTPSNGATCPSAAELQSYSGTVDGNGGTSLEPLHDAAATLPSGASLVIQYRLSIRDFAPRICLPGALPALQNSASAYHVNVAGQPLLIAGNNYPHGQSVELSYQCADMAVTKSVDRVTADPGDPVSYTIRAINAGSGDAIQPEISDTLPAGFVFDGAPGSMTCISAAAGDPCATLSWDVGTRTVSVTPATLAPAESLTLTLTGKAGAAGSYDNTVVVKAAQYFDSEPASDRSTVNLRVVGANGSVAPIPALGWPGLSLLGLLLGAAFSWRRKAVA